MDLDDAVQQWAFGSSRPKHTSCLGLFVSPGVVYAAAVRLKGAQLAVENLLRFPVPSAGASPSAAPAALTDDFLNDAASFADFLNKNLGAAKRAGPDVVVTLSRQMGLFRYFMMPAVERKFWTTAVRLEIKKHVPLALETLKFDFQVIPPGKSGTSKSRQGVLTAVTGKDTVGKIEKIIAAAGLKLAGVEVATCSIARLWDRLDADAERKPYAHVLVDATSLRFLVINKGVPVLLRELLWNQTPSIFEALRRIDFGNSLRFAADTLGSGPVTRALVSGRLPDMAAWRQALSQDAGIPVQDADVDAPLGLRGGDWAAYASVGAAAKFMFPNAINADVAQRGRVAEDELRAAKNILIIGVVLAAFFGISGLVNQVLYMVRSQALARFHREPRLEAQFKGKTEMAIRTMIQAMQGRATVFDGIMGATAKLRASHLLAEVADALPPQLWLRSISFDHPLKIQGRRGDSQLSLSGFARASTRDEEAALILKFKEDLLKARDIAAFLGHIDVAMGADEAGAGRTDANGNQIRLQQTSFSLTLTPAQGGTVMGR